MNADEIWKPVSENPKYEVSNQGRVRNKETGHIKSARRTKNGYLITDIHNPLNGKMQSRYIHRLVALEFVDNPCKLPFINHKDEDKENNRVENLEWCTCEYNLNYGSHNEQMRNTKREKYGKRVRKIGINGETIAEYGSMTEAAEEHNVTVQAIYWALLKPSHTACGYRWEVCE